ncbi:LysR family transcriptional regulator [Shewanella polaris]|uniref:LysR family transcriptional regulator n=1 Tax=Shewanella polaris TaxID=2588449 RepID=A0A4Y5YH70_9GAMM|nr:LysR family transcriptional regulator [Shewanella polaris]QDE31896.1 LysR family transcriptional regulator [Shewanella polaris]
MIDDIEIFIKVTELGSFSAAADSLNLPQSTVSRKIQRLEDQLEVRLLNRTTRQVKVTPAGQEYYLQCVQIFKDLLEANRSVKASNEAPKGLLRITAPIESINLFLGQIINDFLNLYPEIEVDVVASNTMVNPIEQGFDVAIRLANLKDSTLIARSLGRPRDYLCAAPAYIEKYGYPTDIENLSLHKCLRMSNPEPLSTWELKRGKERKLVTVEGPATVNSLVLLHTLTCGGHGIAKLPGYLCRENIDNGSLITLLPDWSFPLRTLSVVYPSSRHLSANVRIFVDYIIEKSKYFDFLN